MEIDLKIFLRYFNELRQRNKQTVVVVEYYCLVLHNNQEIM